MYSKITNLKYRPIVKALILLMIATLNSCMTYETKNLTPDEFVKANDTLNMEVRQIFTTADSAVTASEKNTLTYLSNYKDLGSVFLINSIDTLFRGDKNTYTLKNSNTVLKLNEIVNIKVEKQKFDLTSTVLLSLGIAAASALAVLTIAIIAWSNSWNSMK